MDETCGVDAIEPNQPLEKVGRRASLSLFPRNCAFLFFAGFIDSAAHYLGGLKIGGESGFLAKVLDLDLFHVCVWFVVRDS